MALTKVTGKGITCSAVTEDKLSTSAVTTNKIGPDAVTSAKIQDGQVTADDLASTLDLSSKTVTLSSSLISDLKRPVQDNIALLGFKMAVNDGLTVFNLVDGVVDEFNDESGTDEAEGSNDFYCGTDDFYKNQSNPITISAGFTTTSVTEPDTSTAGTNPIQGCGTFGSFTVPSCLSSVNIYAWGAAGATGIYNNSVSPSCAAIGPYHGGGGGFASGTLATTPGQTLQVVVGEGGEGWGRESPEAASADPQFADGGLGGGGWAARGNGPADPAVYDGNTFGNGGGGLSGVFVSPATNESALTSAPQAYLVAGAGGGSGRNSVPQAPTPVAGYPACSTNVDSGGAGGGLIGIVGATLSCAQTTAIPGRGGGGGGQTQGGQGYGPAGCGPTYCSFSPLPYSDGGLFTGANGGGDGNCAGAGSGYYGGGTGPGSGPGGSSYYSHPQITSGTTEAGSGEEGGGISSPFYVAGTNEGVPAYTPMVYPNGGGPQTGFADGEDGYVLLTACQAGAATSTTIISTTFTSTSVATSARIVVFEENIDTPTLNTDIIASVSRDGTNFTTATLSDSGYVTGSSGQRILTGQADISGQPSGQSMRWKLALANNQVKIHGVALQWS